MTMVVSHITNLTVVYSTVYSDADQSKHQSSSSLAFVWGIHRDRWIPRTKGQLRGKCFHLMTSSWCDTHPCLNSNSGFTKPLFIVRYECAFTYLPLLHECNNLSTLQPICLLTNLVSIWSPVILHSDDSVKITHRGLNKMAGICWPRLLIRFRDGKVLCFHSGFS